MINYFNFFQWYKKEKEYWDTKYPGNMYDPGISNDLFIFFIHLYLYKGNKYASDKEKLKYILHKHSKRYFKEILYAKLFNRCYRDKECWNHLSPNNYRNITSYIDDKPLTSYQYVNIYEQYLTKPILTDPIGSDQIDLGYLEDILEKHSFKFRLEKFMYKKFYK